MKNAQTKLLNFSECGVLPQVAMKDNYEIENVIICSSINGGRNYKNKMPSELILTLLDDKGTEITQVYVQKSET